MCVDGHVLYTAASHSVWESDETCDCIGDIQAEIKDFFLPVIILKEVCVQARLKAGI